MATPLIDVRGIGDGSLMPIFVQGKMLPFLAGRINNTYVRDVRYTGRPDWGAAHRRWISAYSFDSLAAACVRGTNGIVQSRSVAAILFAGAISIAMSTWVRFRLGAGVALVGFVYLSQIDADERRPTTPTNIPQPACTQSQANVGSSGRMASGSWARKDGFDRYKRRFLRHFLRGISSKT
ncbi:hypothetical protein [Paraburkholderia kirstenboschensis]|uniref:hypothetical protein n=1 Tax=Paraburkholderia kirstenboschensis TaxID=1245436 RepID=UPI0013E28949|nr:hypothetical protein [Paraburkholderia kirstenboschensis]